LIVKINMTIESMTENDSLNNEVIQWGYKYLSIHGYILKSEQPENVQNIPWSYVVRFVTSTGKAHAAFTCARS